MKRFVYIVAFSMLLFSSAGADQYVNGYTRSNGTYVEPHCRSDPDGNKFNNYSTQGNENPYNGMRGNKSPYDY